MTVLAFYGAEWGVGNSLFEESLQGTSSVVSTLARSGVYSYRANPTSSATGAPAALSAATIFAEFWFQYATKSTAATGEEIAQVTDSSANIKATLRLRSDGTLGVYASDGTTLLGVSNAALLANTWYHIGIKVGNGTSATWELRIGGFTDISGTGNMRAANGSRLMLGKRADRNSTTIDYFYDDVVIDDAQFNGTTCRVVGKRPNCDTPTQDWTGHGSAPFYTQVADNPSSQTNYIANPAVANKVALFDLEPLDAATILAVKPSVQYRLDTTGTAVMKLRTVSGATTDDDTAINVTSTLALNRNKLYLTDPNTGAAWYYSDVNKLQIGAIETAGVAMRLVDVLLEVLYQENLSQAVLGATAFVAQENGTPFVDNPWLNGTSESGLSPTADPAVHADTRKFNVMAGDLGFTYMGRDGFARILYGDTYGNGWTGAFSSTVPGSYNSTIAAGSNGVDLATMTGAGTLACSSTGLPAGGGVSYAERASDGRRLYFSYTSRTSSTLNGVKFIVASSAGATTVATGDALSIAATWRSQVMARSQDFDLHDGYSVYDMQPLDTHGEAQQLFDSPKGGANTAMYVTALAISAASFSGLWMTLKFTLPHGITHQGRGIKLSGFTPSSFNGEWVVNAIIDQYTVLIGSGVAAVTASVLGTAQIATFSHALRPTASASATRVPSGGVVVPGVGAGGADRDYIFCVNVERWAATAYFSFAGIAYSDDVTAGFTLASDSALITGANGTAGGGGAGASMDIAKFGGTVTDTLTVATSFAWNQNPGGTNVTSGVIEIDTSNGYAYLAFTGRASSTVLTGVSVVRGSGTLLGASLSGARYATFGQYAAYDSPHQQIWPWLHTDGYVYALSIMGYRTGAAFLSRVPQASLLDISAWTFWNGSTWSTDKTAAKPIFSDAGNFGGNIGALGYTGTTSYVGECSLMYHAGVGLWIATYTGSGGIAVRTAPNPQGPWSPEMVAIATSATTSTFYGGHIHPKSGVPPNAPNKLYFHVSLTDPYTVFLTETAMTVTINKELPRRQSLQAVKRASRW